MKKQFINYIISAKILKDNQTTTGDFFDSLRKNNSNIKVTTEDDFFVVSDIENTRDFQNDVRKYSAKEPSITSRIHTIVGKKFNGLCPTYIDLTVSY